MGSSNALAWADDEHGGTVTYQATPDFFDDGPMKPVRIWSRIGKRPIVAAGNSNGDIPMLRYAGGKDRPVLRLLLLHDDEPSSPTPPVLRSRFEPPPTTAGPVVSINDDWAKVFAGV